VGEVHDLVVDSELLSTVGNDEDADGAGTTAKGLLQAGPEVTLVDNLETLLNLAGLGHGDELTVIADVDETVLLEDGAKQGVEDHGRRGVRDNARLLVELLGEQVNTEVTVLTGLGRGGDADDLARTVLKDDKVANADVVAGDGEGRGLSSMDRADVGSTRLVLLGVLGLVDNVGDRVVVVVVTLAGTGVGTRVLVVVAVGIVLAHFDGRFVGDGRDGRDGLERLDGLRGRLGDGGGLLDIRLGDDGRGTAAR